MPVDDFALGGREPMRRLVAVVHCEPFGIAFAIDGSRIATVEQVAELVNQNVVEIKIAQRLLGPDELPRSRTILFPAAAVHLALRSAARASGAI